VLVRTVVGLLLLPLVPLVLFIAPVWVLAACISLISVLAVWECSAPFLPKKRPAVYAMGLAAAIPIWVYHPTSAEWLPYAVLPGFLFLLFLEALADHGTFRFNHIAILFTAAVFIPLFFSSLLRMEKEYILLPLAAALLCDTCAYYTGKLFGKRKLTPVSPKKTVEGAVGGLIGVLIGMVVYALVIQSLFDLTASIPLLLVYGLLGGAAGQIGDLSMSLIKREAGIKDFGKLLPGHGGVLDRFDSVLFAAPVVEILIRFLPAIS
jgi:phosphatidate cytidylyltransferase